MKSLLTFFYFIVPASRWWWWRAETFFYGVACCARESRECAIIASGVDGWKKGWASERLRVKIIIRENPGWWKFCVALWKHTKKTPRLSIFSRLLFAEWKWLNYMPAAISLWRLKRRAGRKSCCKFRALISSFRPFRLLAEKLDGQQESARCDLWDQTWEGDRRAHVSPLNVCWCLRFCNINFLIKEILFYGEHSSVKSSPPHHHQQWIFN